MHIDITKPFHISNPGAVIVDGRFYPDQLAGRLIDPPEAVREGDGVMATNLRYFGMNGCVSVCGMIVEWAKGSAPIVVLMVPASRQIGTSAINMSAELFTSIAANILPTADPRTVNWHTAADREKSGADGGESRITVFSPEIAWKRAWITKNPIKLAMGRGTRWEASSSYGTPPARKRAVPLRAIELAEKHWREIEGDYPTDGPRDYKDIFTMAYGSPDPR